LSDFFALLDEPRRPWLDADVLKQRFLGISGKIHPDRHHGASDAARNQANSDFAALNEAYQCLREPKERLGHLLQLELGGKPKDVQRIPPGATDFFMEVGMLCREVDQFLPEKAKATSPMLKVRLFETALELTDKLQTLQQKLSLQREALLAELKGMNTAWESAPSSGPARTAALPLERLEQIYRLMSYLGRWWAQIQERVVQLSL
jgi:curved DNA-binding protein CbpA